MINLQKIPNFSEWFDRILYMGMMFVNAAIRNPAIINAKRGKMGVPSSKGKANIELYVTLSSFFDELANV